MSSPDALLMTIAVLTLAFLFLGIRNSWDTVTYIAVTRGQPENAEKDPAGNDG